MIKRFLIFGNGILHKKFLKEIRRGDYVIGVDRAAYWLLDHGITPDLAIGDFDSTSQQEFQFIKKFIKLIKRYTPEKNFTDMELAINRAKGETVIFGWSGTRFDHTLATLQLLKNHVLVNETNRIWVIGRGKTVIEKASYKYISILPFTKSISVSLTGFRYNLAHKTIRQGSTLCVSNEITGKKAVIEILSGKAWVIESND